MFAWLAGFFYYMYLLDLIYKNLSLIINNIGISHEDPVPTRLDLYKMNQFQRTREDRLAYGRTTCAMRSGLCGKMTFVIMEDHIWIFDSFLK